MISPGATPKALTSDGSAGGAGTAFELQKDTEEFKKLLESATEAVEDEDVRGVLAGTAKEILASRIEESTSKFEQMVFGKSL